MPYAKIESMDGRYSLIFDKDPRRSDSLRPEGDGWVYIQQQVYAAYQAHMASDTVYQELFRMLDNERFDLDERNKKP